MRLRLGPGPVFAFESLAASRRWQIYALRCLCAALLLAGLWLFWGPSEYEIHTLAEAARIGGVFFRILVVVQLAVVLLAAPAATAGAVCVDKSRGTLLHAFVTDLTEREIVLGKLAARLLPVLSLMACGLPVLALVSMTGGVDPADALGAELVTAGTAVVCCALALLASVWARKPHQALLLAYALVALWVIAAPVVHEVLTVDIAVSLPLLILDMSNPFFASFATELSSPTVPLGLQEQVAFFLAALLLSAGLVAVAASALRPAVMAQANQPARLKKADAPARLLDYLPGPSLDGNAVLWREWHRKRPSLWTARFWTAYAVASLVGSLYVLGGYYIWAGDSITYRSIHMAAAHVNAWQVAIGLLLLTVSAATSLSEERDRGSLDVIMTTPMSTPEIVWGKWLGTFATVPRLAILPIWVAAGAAMVTSGVLGLTMMIGLVLAYSAAITSAGLALATWIRRLGTVIGTSVLAYVLIALGWPLLLAVLSTLPAFQTTSWTRPSEWDGLSLASPFFGIYTMTAWAAHVGLGTDEFSPWGSSAPIQSWGFFWGLFWIGVYCTVALILGLATVSSFDRCIGRINQYTGTPLEPKPEPLRSWNLTEG
jgi:ABC-type transport system involved in multi-copper enzyme maturation permease subunit